MPYDTVVPHGRANAYYEYKREKLKRGERSRENIFY